jgi:hypothetical protein
MNAALNTLDALTKDNHDVFVHLAKDPIILPWHWDYTNFYLRIAGSLTEKKPVLTCVMCVVQLVHGLFKWL